MRLRYLGIGLLVGLLVGAPAAYAVVYRDSGGLASGLLSTTDLQVNSLGVGTAAPGTAGDVTVNDALTVSGTGGGTTFIVDAGTSRFDGAVQVLADSTELEFGAGADASIQYDGTNLLIQPRDVGTGDLILNDTATFFINDTANANMAVGATLNQGSNDNQILALKSSDVATGLSNASEQAVETGDFLVLSKADGNIGGLIFQVMSEDGAVNHPGNFRVYGGQAQTTDTTASFGLINFYASEHDGANALRNAATNDNLFTIQSQSSGAATTRLLLKADDGELHLGNTTLVALDSHEDVQLVRAYVRDRAVGGLAESPYEDTRYTRADLVAAGVLSTESDDALISVQNMFNLHAGAIWQNYERQQEQEKRYLAEIQQLRAQVQALERSMYATRN